MNCSKCNYRITFVFYLFKNGRVCPYCATNIKRHQALGTRFERVRREGSFFKARPKGGRWICSQDG